MASSYSTDLKIELMVTGENAGTWGDKTNANLNVIQQAIAGFKSVSIAGGAQTTNLLINNSPDLATSDARNAVIKLTGTITGNQIVTVPTGIEKTYIVQNGTTGAFTVQFIQSGGTGTTFSTTDKGIKILFADGTNINAVDLSTLSGTVASGAVATASIENLAVTSSKLASFAVTEARLASFAVTSAKLATNAVTAIKITQSTITQSKLAANSVGSNQLISTGVVAATYASATITVDADGRLTAASAGSAGGSMGVPTLFAKGPTSGTYTANPAATRIGAYMIAGGGNPGSPIMGFMEGVVNSGGGGSIGGFGFYNKPIAQPFSQPYAVGGSSGNSSITNVGTVTGGTGGNPAGPQPGNPGNPGSAPGATIAVPTSARPFVIGPPSGDNGGPGLIVVYENIGT